MPVEISFGTTNKITYLYNAAGDKLKKTVTEGSNTIYVDYLNGFQYKGEALQFFPTAEGYVDYTAAPLVGGISSFNYVYQYKDHLGNARVNYTYSAGIRNNPAKITIKDENHYYPFGLKHLNYNINYLEFQEIEGSIVLYPPVSTTSKLVNNYKYNGKEYQDELGLNMYDYGARNYNTAIGRWMNIDPLAERYRRYSPYHFAADNPVLFIDPDGMGYDAFGNQDPNGLQAELDAKYQETVNLGANSDYDALTGGTGSGIPEDGGQTMFARLWSSTFSENNESTVKMSGPETNLTDEEMALLMEQDEGTYFIKKAWSDFAEGFGSKKTNFHSTSAVMGYEGLIATKAEFGIRLISKGRGVAALRAVSPVLKRFKNFGYFLGATTTAVSVYEDYSDNNLGYGTLFKVGIGVASTIFPGFGLGYAIFDLGYGAITGTTFTDSVAAGLDNIK